MPMKHRLPHTVVVRAPGLLPMLYSPTELAEELHIPVHIVREWLNKGLLYRRDAATMSGLTVARWLPGWQQHVMARPYQPLQPDEAFCVNCQRPVKLENPTRTPQGKHLRLSGTCPECGKSIHRGARHG